MSQTTPVRIILRYREQPFQKPSAIINTFFTWRDIQPLEDYYTHICSNPPSSWLYLVLDLYCKTHPNVDLNKLDLEVFQVLGIDSFTFKDLGELARKQVYQQSASLNWGQDNRSTYNICGLLRGSAIDGINNRLSTWNMKASAGLFDRICDATEVDNARTDGGGSSDKDNRDISLLGVPPDEVQGRGRRTPWRTTAAAGAEVLVITHDCRVALTGSLNVLHYKLETHNLKELVRYVGNKSILEAHNDVPDVIREQLYREEQRRLEKRQSSGSNPLASNPPYPINTTVANATPAIPSDTNTHCLDCPKILGPRDDAVKAYRKRQELNVTSETYNVEIRKACDVTLENCLDLEQIFNDQHPTPNFLC
ncbi:conserved hypothetical protein [Histoplasma capsulatum H143]|uniref:Uncharacterized protein n=1 Tax=Ajellomyces capsulatus (strain H143) TaxID=544712 RepID=C6HAW3_AJECH|nr:conserved hypothetical protein [Histoplasma capsulatum H143]